MEQSYNNKMKELGYNQLVCDIFIDWEDVKDELLIPERKSGSGNGTIHVFLGKADEQLRKEFASYYSVVEEGEDPSHNAVNVKHYFLKSNVISMLGYLCKYCYDRQENLDNQVKSLLSYLQSIRAENGLIATNSLFKLSTGASKLRPYFKQFDSDGIFSKLIRRILLPNSAYKISLFKNNSSEYAAFWLLGFDSLTDFEVDSVKTHLTKQNENIVNPSPSQTFFESPNKDTILPYLTALRTKPFMLIAGISGTGKSRIVRELAKACWKEGDEEFGKNNPKNFCMVQVKPNWHDSSELIGYVSRINGEKYVVGPFLRFLAKAIKDPSTPYFLCLDEMNLAPVEQYFAEYLSVIESRKLNADGSITTDPIVPYEDTEAYGTLIDQLFADEADRKAYKSETNGKRLTIPQNLFVVGTVNMDETTFSFSRKVLDRAMTIEMNEVNLYGGLDEEGSEIGYIGNCIIGDAAEGKDVYAENKELCDEVIAYLEKVNTILEGTPFKIAYRTRNEFLLYAVNRKLLDNDSQLWQTLDEMTSMKILSRIEGDSERTKEPLNALKTLVEQNILNQIPEPEDGKEKAKSIAAAKIKEMLDKLEKTSYTSYWA